MREDASSRIGIMSHRFLTVHVHHSSSTSLTHRSHRNPMEKLNTWTLATWFDKRISARSGELCGPNVVTQSRRVPPKRYLQKQHKPAGGICGSQRFRSTHSTGLNQWRVMGKAKIYFVCLCPARAAMTLGILAVPGRGCYTPQEAPSRPSHQPSSFALS